MKSRREFLRKASYLLGDARLLPSVPIASGSRGTASTEADNMPIESPRTVLPLDGGEWKLVGLEFGQGEKLGVNLRDSAKVTLSPTSVPNDVQLAIGIKDVYSQDPAIFEVNKREWWYIRSFSSPKLTLFCSRKARTSSAAASSLVGRLLRFAD